MAEATKTPIGVRYQTGDRQTILIRGHRIVTDQPVAAGGEDQGPTPTELFVASLAACVGFYAERLLRRHTVHNSLQDIPSELFLGSR